MKHIEGHFQGVRNTSIFFQAWLPEQQTKAVLMLVHGLGEHCGRYANIAGHFVALGYAVYGFDHIGHGKSAGKPEYIHRFADYTDTLAIYFELVKKWQLQTPIFLLGHSMGGLIATYFLLDHQDKFNGAILSAPSLKVSGNIPNAIIFIAKILSVLTPQLGLMALDTRTLSRDPAVVAACANDPLVFHGKTPARQGAELLKAMRRVTAEAANITLPFLVLQGSEDRIVDPDGARMLFEQASSRNKTLKMYEGLYHEVFNEPEHELVFRDVATWLADMLTHQSIR